jgi:predicted nucleic acid-binding protein
MSAALIIGCSIAMSWCFPDESTRESSKILDRLVTETALVPSHWFLEVANVLIFAEKRKRITSARSRDFLNLLNLLDIEVDHEAPVRAFQHILPLARQYGLTSYDAAYLELALRRGLPMATLDDYLRSAAGAADVEVLGK